MKTLKYLPEQKYRLVNYFTTGSKEGCCCSECGTYITKVCVVKGEDGETYQLGTTCIEKINKERKIKVLSDKDEKSLKTLVKENKKAAEIMKMIKDYEAGHTVNYYIFSNMLEGSFTWMDPKKYLKKYPGAEIVKTWSRTWKAERIIVDSDFDLDRSFKIRFIILCENGDWIKTDDFRPGWITNYMEFFKEYTSVENWIHPECVGVKNTKEAKEKFIADAEDFSNYLKNNCAEWYEKLQKFDGDKWVRD